MFAAEPIIFSMWGSRLIMMAQLSLASNDMHLHKRNHLYILILQSYGIHCMVNATMVKSRFSAVRLATGTG